MTDLPVWSPEAVCGLLIFAAFCCFVLGLAHLEDGKKGKKR
jgi:hypothetical protein